MHSYVFTSPRELLFVGNLIFWWLGQVYKREACPIKVGPPEKNIRLLSAKIANNKNFSGKWEELHCLPTQDLLTCVSRVFEPLLGVLAILSDPEDVGGQTNSPCTTCYLKL